MKQALLFIVISLFIFSGANAQNEDSPVFTKSLSSVIEDAKFIVADSHYTTGQTDLQKAINAAESSIATLAGNEDVRQTLVTLQAAIDAFVYANPHADATENILNPSFDKDGYNSRDITSWTTRNMKQNRRSVSYPTTRTSESGDVTYVITNFVEQWTNTSNGNINGSGNISQVIKDLPAGHYRLTADIFANNQRTEGVTEEATGIELYANDAVRQIGLTDIGGGTNAAAFSVDFEVGEGQEPTIGFRFKDPNINWLGWDNVTLFYIGDPEAYKNIVSLIKITAAKEALAVSVKAANEALADENAPFYNTELKAVVDAATALTDAATLEELTEAKTNIDTELATFNNYNKHYAALKAAIDAAEVLIASGMTNGATEFQEAINTAKTQLATATSDYIADSEGGVALTDTALEKLQKAEYSFRVLNASYANPINLITNGDMASTAGWTILAEGANPDLHINTSGSVTNFSTPFMECWVNNTNYGRENYARQTINALPNGQELPAGYYVLKAAALATRQDQANLKVTGVTLKFQDQEVDVQTANGVANIYTLGFDKKEAGGELTFGLYIDEATDANWIAWDEVELQFVGNKSTYNLMYMVDGQIYKTVNYVYGAAITPIASPTKEGYTFSGWSEIPETMPAKDFIVTGTFTQNPTEKCATPTISYKDGELSFSSETESVEYCYTVTTPSSLISTGEKVKLTTKYTVSVYAKKDGYLDSDVATKEIDIQGLKGDANGDGTVTVTDIGVIVDIILGKNTANSRKLQGMEPQ